MSNLSMEPRQKCARLGCYKDVTGRRGKKFCSDSCRAQAWRDVNVPHCPHCGGSLTVTIAAFKRENKGE